MRLLALLLVCGVFYSSAVTAATVTGVRMSATPIKSRLVFDVDAPVEYLVYSTADSMRLAIKILQGTAGVVAPDPLDHDHNIDAIHFVRRDSSDLTVEIDLMRPAQHRVFVLKPRAGYGDRLVVDIEGVGTTSAQAGTPASPVPVGPAEPWSSPEEASRAAGSVTSGKHHKLPALAVSPGDDDELSPRDAQHRLTDRLFFGARLETTYTAEGNYDLDKSRADDLAVWESLVALAFAYRLDAAKYAFLSIEPTFRDVRQDERRRRSDVSRLELKQAYFSFSEDSLGLRTAIGRQPVEDQRAWLFDEELDAITVRYDRQPFQFDLLAGENRHKDLLNDGDDDKVRNYGVFGRRVTDDDNEFILYAIHQEDRSEDDSRLWFIGAHAHGEAAKNLDYWLDGAILRGRANGTDIRGYGFDLGATHTFKTSFRPAFTVAYAFGSGDANPNDGVNRDFRQTGLQDNEAKFGGIEAFKYYGEAFDPELSNLQIVTLGAGARPFRNFSIDLVLHRYHQHYARDEIRDAEIDEHPDGKHRHLGDEVDLIAAYRNERGLRLSIKVGLFDPKDAYPDKQDRAVFSEAELRYRF